MYEYAGPVILLVVIVLFFYWLLAPFFSRRMWHCSECGFSAYDEHEILGHQEYHKRKHVFYQD